MKLTKTQFKALVEALCSAFPSYQALVRAIQYGLGENLRNIAGENATLHDVAFNLVQWAETKGRLDELVEAMRQENPGNPDLKAIAQELLGQPGGSVRPAVTPGAPARQDPTSLVDVLSGLLPAQFDMVVYKLGVPVAYIPSSTAPLASRVIDVVRWADQAGRLADLQRLCDEATGRRRN